MTKLETKIEKIKIPKQAPFANDALNREELCKIWTNFIESSSTPFILAVDAEWGDGKTTFLEMWRKDLKLQEFKTVFFDAWSCDFYDEALPPLIGEIQKQIGPEPSFENTANKLIKLLPSVPLSIAIKPVINIMTQNIAKDAMEQIQEMLQPHEKIQDYLKYQDTVDEFKQELVKTAESVKEKSGKPLVIFIDELDRCRPIFAIEVLEKVKHIFDVKFIFFIIAVNKNELKKSINTVYGEIDSEYYLQKFFDLTISLPNTKNLIDISIKKTGLENLMKEQDRLQELTKIKEELELFSKTFNVSPRNQEQLAPTLITPLLKIKNLKLEHPLSLTYSEHSVLLAYFVTLRLINPDLYTKFTIAAENDDNTVQLPSQENLEYYRKHADFPDPLTSEETIPREHFHAYMYLCGIHYEENKKFREEIEEILKAKDSANKYLWGEVKKFGSINNNLNIRKFLKETGLTSIQ